MAETKKGNAPKACKTCKTGTAGKSGNASKTGKTAKAGESAAARAAKPLTERQRELKRERDRNYRLRKSGKISGSVLVRGSAPEMTRGRGHLCGDVPCAECSEYGKCRNMARTDGFKPLHGMTQAEADFRKEQRKKAEREESGLVSAARAWYDSAAGSVKPGERTEKTFSDGKSWISVRVSRALDGSLRTVTERRLSGDASMAAGRQVRFSLPAQGPSGVFGGLVLGLLSLAAACAREERAGSDVRAIVDARRGWLSGEGKR